jgi:hypothetical protein
MKLPVSLGDVHKTPDGDYHDVVSATGSRLLSLRDGALAATIAAALNRQAAADKLAEAVDTFFTEMGDMLQGDAQVAAANKLDAALSDYRSEAKG